MKDLTYYTLRIFQEINYRVSGICYRLGKLKKLNGVEIEEKKVERLSDISIKQNDYGIKVNRKYPAGNVVEICTDASVLDIEVLYRRQAILSHMSISGTSGIDIYVRGQLNESRWVTNVVPDTVIQMRVRKRVQLDSQNKKSVLMYLPPYAEIEKIRIGCVEQNYIEQGHCEQRKKVVFYGSSITQGCAASRPSLSYANILSRKLGVECINYGFSESAKGQQYIITHMMQQNPQCVVLEYDHNADLEELKGTHLQVYEAIRRYNKFVPIVMLSRFSGQISISPEEESERIQIIQETQRYANENGDEKVFFISGKDSLKDKTDCFVDDRHPNDFGMQQIAGLLENVLCKVLMINEI